MKNVILFRKHYTVENEFLISQKYFPVSETRIGLKDSLVIPRYSLLPYPKELERDLKLQGSYLINNLSEHEYIASFDYYHDLKKYTPKTYFQLSDVPKNENKKYVIKGKTNSRKQQWKEKMFADSYDDVVRIYNDLLNDPYIAEQGVIIREFEKLENYGTGLNGMDFANEWRFFFYKKTLLTYGYYWSIGDIIPDKSSLDPQAIELAKEMAEIASHYTNFFVLDLAKTEDGRWILIEMNDGCQSGLSENNPDELYKNLSLALKNTP